MASVGGATQLLLIISICWIGRQSYCQITFTIPPSNIIVARGNRAIFNCSFTSSGSVSINWQRNGSILSPSLSKYTYLVNNSLLIDPTESGDEGLYACVVTDQNTGESSTLTSSLTFAYITNSFLSSPESQTVDEGLFVNFFCIHSGSLPPASILWTLNNNVIVTSSRISIQTSILRHTNPPQVSSSLAITSIQRSDMGRVKCTATNPLLPGTTVTSEEAVLTIRVQPYPPSITQQPNNTIILESQVANLSCSADGQPVPMLTWVLNGVLLTPSSRISIVINEGISILMIAGVDSASGLYQCIATNSEGTAISDGVQIQIASLGTSFALEPPDTTAVIGESVILDCSPPPSVPPATITWSRDFAQLNNARFQVLGNGSLMISNVELQDQAIYHCLATNSLLGVTRASRGAIFTAIGEPTVIPSITTVTIGQSASFFCSAAGNPSPQITWYRGTNQITVGTPRLSITGSTLTISDIVIEDRGYYTCRAVFPSGTTEVMAFLNILVPPSFQISTLNLTAIPSSSVTLPCATFPDQTITFTWFFESTILFPLTSRGALNLSQNGSLTITNVQSANEGMYTCMATNNVGTANGTVYLDVLTAPRITADLANVTTVRGSSAILHCIATGDPIPIQSWSRNGVTVLGSRFQISSRGDVLSVNSVRDEDGGLYTCHASNPAGNSSANITLTVNFPPSAMVTPTSLTINAGSTANFTCTATGNPTPQIRWLTGASVDVTTLGDARIDVEPVTGGGMFLVIRDLRGSDQQQYICRATNIVSMDTALVSLNVLVAPSVNISMETVGIQGNSFLLDCNPIGQPAPVMSWFRGEEEVEEDSRLMVDNQGRLGFSTLFSTDSGTYTCIASSPVGVASAETVLRVLVVPVIQVTTSTIIANENSSAILDCLATGNPPPTVTWFFNFTLLPNPPNSRIQQASNNSLLISPVATSDRGGYICRATNIVGTESASIQLIVYVIPEIRAVESTVTVVIGNTVTMTCVATGDPIPVQTWIQNGTNLSGTRFQISADGSALTVRDTREEDEGTYSCQASNPASIDIDMVTLNVIVPPSFMFLMNSTATESSLHSLICLALGDPFPSITWTLGGQIVPSTQGVITFDPVLRGNAGIYTCIAMNAAGTVSGQVFLDVLYLPDITQPPVSLSIPIGTQAQFTCIAIGNPPPQISWLFNGVVILGAQQPTYTITNVTTSDTGTYRCVATNSVGVTQNTAALAVIVPPSATTLVSVEALSSSSLSMQWTAVTNNGGSPLTFYLIEYRDSANSTAVFQSQSFGADSISATLSGLAPFITYEVRVRGENIAGLSDPSNVLTARTHPEAPSAPRNFGVVSSTPSTVTVRWDLPSPLNGRLALYQLRYAEELSFDSTLQERLIFFSTQYTIPDVRVGVVYLVEVRASTVSLSGEELEGPYATLRVRDGIQLEVTTTQIPTVSTTEPPTTEPPATTEPPTTEPPTTDFPTTEPPTTEPQTTNTEESSTADPVTTEIPDMTTESPTTSLPLSPPTSVPSVVSCAIPPGRTGEILVFWREPSPPSDDFTGYSITISPVSPPTITTPILVSRPGGTYVFMGLFNFTTYTVTVATYNSDGVGPLTESSTISTPEAAPSAPRGIQVVTLSSTTVIVSWLPPDSLNGVLIHYTLKILIDTTGQEVSTRTVSVGRDEQDEVQVMNIDGLDLDNVRYRILVSASTGAGIGPDSEPTFIGIEVRSTIVPSETTDTLSSPTETPIIPTEPPIILTNPPIISTKPSIIPSQTSAIIQATPIATPTTEETRNKAYYVIRIIPPVVGVFLLVGLVLVGIVCCVNVRDKQRKKGLYQVESDHHLKQIPEVGEQVFPDGIDDTAFIKEALDSNFTYRPISQGPSEDGSVDETDLGETFGDQVILAPPTSAVGRDAVQEQDDQSHDVFMPSHTPMDQTHDSYSIGSHSKEESSVSGQWPIHQPGEQSYAEMNAIHVKKAEERARQLGGQGYARVVPTRGRVKYNTGSTGISSGGIMETRIGVVGKDRHVAIPEGNAQLY